SIRDGSSMEREPKIASFRSTKPNGQSAVELVASIDHMVPRFTLRAFVRHVYPAFGVLVGVGTMAQSGPAGVGDPATNILWLSADHGIAIDQGVSIWADRSGNANHAGQVN